MDQNRETLRANIFCVTFECERDQRNLFIRAVTTQANFFVLLGHGFSVLFMSLRAVLWRSNPLMIWRLLRREDRPPRNDMILQRPFIHPAIYIQHHTCDI